jgi:hypothetical protein
MSIYTFGACFFQRSFYLSITSTIFATIATIKVATITSIIISINHKNQLLYHHNYCHLSSVSSGCFKKSDRRGVRHEAFFWLATVIATVQRGVLHGGGGLFKTIFFFDVGRGGGGFLKTTTFFIVGRGEKR